MAKAFEYQSLMPMFQLSLILLQSLLKVLNSKFFIRSPYNIRIYINVCVMVVAYSLLAFAVLWDERPGFFVALTASVLHGVVSGFGESTAVAWFKCWPGELIGAFSSGTGMSGLGGTSMLLIFKSIPWF